MKTAVLIPCYDEAPTIAKVIQDFREALPDAEIYVYDNNSKDNSARIARDSGAIVRSVKRQGKGAVVRAMFREVDADIYVTVDGDDTYPASGAKELVDLVVSGQADMAVGDRHSGGGYAQTHVRRFHSFGNRLVTRAINLLFGCKLRDIMSGLRAFNRDFVESCPILLDGFEAETLMTLHALERRFEIVEIPIAYRDRPAGSTSKLNTVNDGLTILRTILWVFKDSKPLIFFAFLGSLCFLCAFFVGAPAVFESFRTGVSGRIATLIVASTLTVIGVVLVNCGFILDTVVKLHREDCEVGLINRRRARK